MVDRDLLVAISKAKAALIDIESEMDLTYSESEYDELEVKNSELKDEIADRDSTINELETCIENLEDELNEYKSNATG